MSMTSAPHLAAALAVALFQSGCVSLAASALGAPLETPDTSEPLEPPAPPEPTTVAYAGEIRDFGSFRLEPGAGLEFWSEKPGFEPTARLDGRGGFSVRVDVCRRMSTPGENLAWGLVFGGSAFDPTCYEPIGRYALRARLGARCSAPFGEGAPAPEVRGTPVLFLTDCVDLHGGGREWRPVAVADP